MLFVAQGFDGIQPGGFEGRIPAGAYPDCAREGECHGNCRRGDQGRPSEKIGNYFGGTYPGGDSQGSAQNGKDHSLRQELKLYVAARGTYGHANSDLACTLGNGNEHDIHDSDSPDNEADEGNASQEQGHDPVGVVRQFSHICKIAHREVWFLTGWDLVSLAQKVCNLLLGRRGGILGDRRNHDAVDVCNPHDLLLDGCVGGDDRIVLVRPSAALSFRLQYSDDAPGGVSNPDLLPHGILPRKEHVDDRLSQDADTLSR